jgi:hypothetical protein
MPILSLRGYARHRGCALNAVQKAVATGRVSTLPDGSVDSAIADAEWERNTRARPPTIGSDEDGFGGNQYSKARAVREHYLARLAKIDFEERIGKLVPKDDVEISAFNKYRQFRDHMLNIPDRLGAVVAAESEPAKVYEVLSTEIRKALNEFADANG